MPELPEVETIRRGLLPHLLDQELQGFDIGDRKIFQFDLNQLGGLEGQRVRSLERRGKFLIFKLDRNTLVIHLGMTGQLTIRDPDQNDAGGFIRHSVTGLQRTRQHPPDKHTHFQIYLGDSRTLMYRDIRKFGKIFLLPSGEAAIASFLGHLGLEPLEPEYQLPPFLERMGKRKCRVKSLLLDQGFVAGVGNIYADEALFEARVHPGKRVRYLRRFQKEALFDAIPRVLAAGIAFGGTSLRDYINSEGESGNHQQNLKVYGREGEPCLVCGCGIKRVIISQRSSHFCPSCQKR